MREHLYCGKTINNGEWVYGFYWNRGEFAHYIKVINKDGNLVGDYEVIPETVGEFTGLTDKNGKKIFEGDIVEFDGDSKRDNVVWNNGEYNGVTGFRLKRYVLFSITMLNHDLFEVIGNIHDNPELLK